MMGPNFKWSGLVAVILAVGVASALVVLAVTELRTPEHITGEEATVFSTTIGAAVGALAAYLGARSQQPPGPGDTPPE